MAHPNEDQLKKGYEAFSQGDLATLGELFTDDIVWHVSGRSPIAGDYRGKDETFGFFAKLAEETGGTFRLEVHDLLANDEHGVGLAKSSGERNGKTLDSNFVNVFHFKDGKVSEVWGHADDQYAVDEFYS